LFRELDAVTVLALDCYRHPLSRLVVWEAMRMSRRNARQGKTRRRAERDRRQRPGTSDQGPRAVEDRAVQADPRPGGSGPRNPDAHGPGLRSDADGGLNAVDLEEADLDTGADLENADLGDFGGLDPDDAVLQAALAEENLVEAGISDVAEEGDLAVDDIGDAAGESLAASGRTWRT